MAKNHVAGNIDSWAYTAGADITSGDVVVMSDVTGVSLGDIADGAMGSVAIAGAFALPKGADTFSQGDTVDWSGTAVIAGAGAKIGVVRDAAETGDATVNVWLER